MKLTADTKIRLSQIVDLKEWHAQLVLDKHGPKVQTGTVRRWADGKLHEKTNNGWKVVAYNKEYNVVRNTKEEKKNRKTPQPSAEVTQKQFNDFVDDLFVNPHLDKPKAVRLPDMSRHLKKQLGIDKNTAFIFSSRYFHISPARKAGEGQDLRREEYKQLPEFIRNAKQAILTRKNGGFKLLFKDSQNPDKVNKIIFNKTNRGNFIINVSKVDKRNGFDPKTEKVVGEGVAPSI